MRPPVAQDLGRGTDSTALRIERLLEADAHWQREQEFIDGQVEADRLLGGPVEVPNRFRPTAKPSLGLRRRRRNAS